MPLIRAVPKCLNEWLKLWFLKWQQQMEEILLVLIQFKTEIFSTQLCQNWPYQSYLSSATNSSDGLSPKMMKLGLAWALNGQACAEPKFRPFWKSLAWALMSLYFLPKSSKFQSISQLSLSLDTSSLQFSLENRNKNEYQSLSM